MEATANELMDRYRGALLGLAAGDAVGTTLEFRRRGTFEPIADMEGGGPFGLTAGQWTDDTSMALCLAVSLLEKGGFDAADQMERYCRWRREGYLSSTGTCFDIGITTGKALDAFERTGEPLSGSTDPMSAGNGSIMRLAPVPLYFFPDRRKAVLFAAESSRTTHGAAECIDACKLFSAMLVVTLSGAEKEEILFGAEKDAVLFEADGGSIQSGVEDETFPAGADDEPAPSADDEEDLPPGERSDVERPRLEPAIDDIAAGAYRRKTRDVIKGSGYVVESLEAALWCFWTTGSFEEAVLEAANLGDDADTTAAVCGQIAGAYYGVNGIPSRWLARLAMREEIAELAARLSGR